MVEKEKILIIDDNIENIKLAANIIKNEDRIIWTALNGKNGIEISKTRIPDLILLDIQMPEMDGFEVCNELKSSEITKEIPVIFMTTRGDEASIEKAFEIGAVDYIVKPIKRNEVIARVRTHLMLSRTIKDLERAAYTDGLTKLYNHNKIFNVLEHEIIRADRYGGKLSIMMADIDFFKKVNDNYGHSIGDLVLEGVAAEISKTIRNIDIAGRYGGEEFLIIFLEVSKDESYIGAERIRKNIEKMEFERNFKITISGGIAQYTGETILEFIEKADKNLYKAKNNGRNRIEL